MGSVRVVNGFVGFCVKKKIINPVVGIVRVNLLFIVTQSRFSKSEITLYN